MLWKVNSDWNAGSLVYIAIANTWIPDYMIRWAQEQRFDFFQDYTYSIIFYRAEERTAFVMRWS